uniref:Myosin class ii heavy chain n=1 Tax=Macrostomum lignano TaxID=282301 RepID=A0A1I8GH34_9PLAT
LKSARSCSNLPSPVKPSAGSVSNGRCSVADSNSDKEVAGSYVESLERKLRSQEAECRALARERCQLSAQLQDSVEYIGDLERELLRLQESEQGAATGADHNYVVEEEEKHPMELREEVQYNDILCSELAEENDQLREQINQLMRELQSLATQRDSPEMAAVATADVAAQTLCSLKDEETQANDNSAEAAAAVAAATAAAKVTSLKLRLSELERERQITQKRVESLTLQIAESTDRYKQLQVAHQSSLAAENLARDEADSLRQHLAALQAAEAAETQQAVD